MCMSMSHVHNYAFVLNIDVRGQILWLIQELSTTNENRQFEKSYLGSRTRNTNVNWKSGFNVFALLYTLNPD